MAERRVIGLRFCGGYNPRYDRMAAVERLRAQLPEVTLCPTAPSQAGTLVVCGCPARCASVSDLEGERIYLCAPEEMDVTVVGLQRLAGLSSESP